MRQNKTTIKLYQIILFFSLLLVACKEETTYHGLSGELTGTIQLMTSQGYTEKDNSGITVTIDGTDPLRSTTTDNKGHYSIQELETGTYNLIFSKEGYGDYKALGYKFVGGETTDIYGPLYLYHLPTITFNQLSIETQANYYNVDIYGSAEVDVAPGENRYINALIFLSKTPDVSFNKYLQYQKAYYYSSEKLQFSLNLDLEKYPPGTKLYAKLYSCTTTTQSYIDINSGLEIFTTLAQPGSNIAEFTIPELKN
jgi:hypothetical protein